MNKRQKRVAIYAAGDSNIVFPALVAMHSIERFNPGVFDKFLCLDSTELTESQREQARSIGIRVVDTAEVIDPSRIHQLEKMAEGRWPIAVYVNWAIPEYLFRLGYHDSVKIDYDVVCLGALDKFVPRNKKFFCSALLTQIDTAIPQEALEAIAQRTGLSQERKFSINSGVMAFNNAYCHDIRFFDTLYKVVQTMNEMCPKLRTIEQAALALIASNYEKGFEPLPRAYNQRAIALTAPVGFEPDVKIVHFLTKYKPWLEITDADLVKLGKRGGGLVPLYRNLWFDIARDVPGFEEFTDQRPLDSLQLIGAASAMVLSERQRIPALQDAHSTRRWDLSHQVVEKLSWTIRYGPFKGLRLAKTWWRSRSEFG